MLTPCGTSKMIQEISPRKLFAAAVLAVATLPTMRFAAAQGPGGLPFSNDYRRPSTSRYQNIANFANNPLAASNIYQSMVLPAQELDRTRLEQLSQARRLGNAQEAIRRLQMQPSGLPDQTIRPTGHSATFLNYSHFFPTGR